MTSNAPLGVFEEQVIVAVVRTAPEAYGMSIRRELERVTLRDVAIGAVYATLTRLEEKRFVSTWLSDPLPIRGGRARKHWRLTPLGDRALRSAANALAGMLDGLGLTPQPRRS